jgi:hypothetical protein
LGQNDPLVEARLSLLVPGDRLVLVEETDNPYNQRALLVSENQGTALGWVPDLLLDYVHELRAHGRVEVVVSHVNGSDIPTHMRLLIKLQGQVTPGYCPFDGPGWATFRAP